MFSIGIITLAGRRISRASFVIMGAVLGIVAAVVVACESPQPPVSCGAIPQQTLTVGETAMVSACFDDPNGDVLVYAARSSDPGVAKATGSGSSVTVTAVSPGDAKVTIRADDPDGLTAEQMFAVLVPNRPPLVVGEIADRELAVGESLTLDVPGYFSEPDGQALVYAAALGAGVVEGTMTGESLTMVALAKGTAPVTLTATDPGGLTATLGFSVTVPNRGPVARDTVAARTIEVGEAATVDMSPFFSDPDGDELAYTAVTSDGALATAEVSGSVIRVTAVAKGSAMVTVTATDTEGAAATQSFGVTVPNRIPVAVGAIAAQTVEVGQEVSLEMGSFFTDPDGDPLAYEVATGNPAVAAAAAGDRAVTVAAVAKGSTTVTVTATDTEGSAATQSFAVTVPNRPPLAAGTIPARTMEAGDEATLDMASFFTDPDGDPLGYAVVVSDAAVVAASAAEGAVVLSAVAKGEAMVTVTGTDTEGLTATQAFSVTVPNRAPVAGESVAARTIEVGEAATVDMSPHFSDPDGDELAYTAVTSDGALATAEVSGSVIRVTAVAKGSAMVTVTATDTEGAAATQSFGVTVPNRVPVAVGAIAAQTVEVGQEVSLEMGSFFTDPDGDPLAYEVATGNPAVASASAGDRAVAVAAVAKGSTTVTVTATDTEGSAATQSFAVTVPNRPPLAAGTIPAQTMEAGNEATLDMASFFTDPDGDPLGYAVVVSDAAVVAASAAEGAVVLTAMTKGETTVTITAADNEGLIATQAFAVTVPNRAPVAGDPLMAQTIEVGEAATVDMSPHFSDPEGDALGYAFTVSEAAVATIESTGAQVTVTAVARGEATVTVTATDTEGLAATLDFAVKVPNRVPVAMESIAARMLYKDSVTTVEVASVFMDPDGDALAYAVASSDPAVVQATATGTTVTVAAVGKGEATVTVWASDGEGIATRSFAVTVPNRAPFVPGRFSTYRMERDDTLKLGLAQYFADPDGDRLEVEAESSKERIVKVAVEGGSLVLAAGRRGTAKVTVTATDPEGLGVEQEFRVRVVRPGGGGGGGNENQPPVVSGGIAARTVTDGEQFTVELGGHFSDPDGDPLTFSATSADEGMFGVVVSGSSLTVTGVGAGTAEVTVTASDPGNLTATVAFAVTVEEHTGGNRSPAVTRMVEKQDLEPEGTFETDLDDHFRDPDGDALAFSTSNSDDDVADVEVSDGDLMVTAVANGTAQVSVTARDPDGMNAKMDFTVQVRSPGDNRAPEVKGQGVLDKQYVPTSAYSMNAWWHFRDPDDDPLSYSATSSNEAVARIEQDDPGHRHIRVRAVSDGESTITVKAEDPQGASLEQAFRFVVKNGDTPYVWEGRWITALPSMPGQVDTIAFSQHFWDDDRYGHGEVLRYSASSTDTAIVTVPTRYDYVDITGKAVGQATVTLTATDLAGQSVSMSFVVTVDNNRPPVVQKAFPRLPSLPLGDTISFTLADYFEDPEDGDNFTYSDSIEGNKIWVEISNGVLYIGTDSTTTVFTMRRVWITATDTEGKPVTQTFRVLVLPPSSNDSDAEPQQLVLSSPALPRATLLPRGRAPTESPPAGFHARSTAARTGTAARSAPPPRHRPPSGTAS